MLELHNACSFKWINDHEIVLKKPLRDCVLVILCFIFPLSMDTGTPPDERGQAGVWYQRERQ